jgi:4-amino-4-deoxy-L-arabinose transferase-like glycosyltransferase
LPRPAAVTLAASLLAYAVLAYGYIHLTPIWQNPDEPAHYNFVAFVAGGNGLPVLQPGDWDSGLLERLKNGTFQPGDSVGAIRYESWQPPLFYLLAAPAFRLGPNDPLAAVDRLRTFNAVLGGFTVVLSMFIARQVFLLDWMAAVVPLVVVGVPMFTAVSSSISADPLANLIAAAILLVLLIRLNRSVKRPEWWALGVGTLLGLGMLTKLELAIFGPLILGVVVIRSTHRVRELVLAAATTAILMVPWLVHQVTSYGWTDPFAIGRHASVVQDQPRFPGFSVDWLVQFLTVSFHSFWAQLGWMAIVAPDRLYVIWGLVSLVALVGLVRAGACWFGMPAWRLLLATVGLALVAYVGYNLAFVQFQARYVFTALAPIAALLVRGWSGGLPRRGQPWTVLVVAAALVALNAYALIRVLVPGFAPSL